METAVKYLMSTQNITIPGFTFNISCAPEKVDWLVPARLSWLVVFGLFCALALLGEKGRNKTNEVRHHVRPLDS